MLVEIENLRKEFDSLVAVDDVSLSIRDGEFLTLVGPSGCGKTTTLRCIAGLEDVTSGTIRFGDRDVTNLSPQERHIAFVFQNYALYPHMTARRNMSFALEDEGLPDDEIVARVEETAEMLGIADHLDQRPGELSGGQQQRVALGRSIVRDPDVFLLDEPLSNLDAKLRVQMRAELQKIHDELDRTMIYVTHDQEEAMTMSDRIAIMNDGRLQQVSTPEEAYYKPTNRFVAGFIGSPAMNFLPCSVTDDEIVAGRFTLDRPEGVSDAAVELGVRPEDLVIENSADAVSATVNVFEQIGSFNVVYLDVDDHDEEVIAQVDATTYVDPGERVGVAIEDSRFHLFDDRGEALYHPSMPSEEVGGRPPTMS